MFADVKFEAPAPGPWELETSHFSRPITRFSQQLLVRAFPQGFRESVDPYGIQVPFIPGMVNGFVYMQRTGGGSMSWLPGPPPKALVWLVVRLLPAMRASAAKCAHAFAIKQWRIDLDRWDHVDQPQCVAQHEALQAEDPQTLDTEGLITHLRRAQAHMEAMIVMHHRYSVPSVLPVGDYLANVCAWTGASSGEALELLRGSTPVAKGIAAAELDVLVKALRASEEGRKVLEREGAPQAALDALMALPGEVGPAARAYLDVVRHRSIGYDVPDKTIGELPEMLVRAIRVAVSGDTQERSLDDLGEKQAALRQRVPFGLRGDFDALLEEARAVNRLRDERGLYSDSVGTGLARRAVLEVGRRLVAAGKLEDAEHVVDLQIEEMIDLLRGRSGPSITEIEKHRLWRMNMTLAEAPPWLNAPPGPHPPLDVLPATMQRVARAMNAVQEDMMTELEVPATPEPSSPRTVVQGLSINTGVYEGTARVVIDPVDFDRLQKGDVLITRATSAYFNVVLPLLGAIVTDRGGQLSHAAIVAREYGIPGIVATKVATVTIPDGARVRVDGATGEVTVLSAPAAPRPAAEARAPQEVSP
ncbi:PEP-utilizing enzyme [Chondromyces crocatus]|uniref:PEP-utilizing enzyme n=1 Tax=Chondromyces crocatus TaxID=52 RepID=UPI00067CC8A1|nr:PEP-utilizing enzyme [Chondromyces crocatus]